MWSKEIWLSFPFSAWLNVLYCEMGNSQFRIQKSQRRTCEERNLFDSSIRLQIRILRRRLVTRNITNLKMVYYLHYRGGVYCTEHKFGTICMHSSMTSTVSINSKTQSKVIVFLNVYQMLQRLISGDQRVLVMKPKEKSLLVLWKYSRTREEDSTFLDGPLFLFLGLFGSKSKKLDLTKTFRTLA
jgi:hypothetical protein